MLLSGSDRRRTIDTTRIRSVQLETMSEPINLDDVVEEVIFRVLRVAFFHA